MNSGLGLLIHLSLTLLFFVWAGKENSFHFTLPKMPLLVGVGDRPGRRPGAVFLVPWGRHHMLWPASAGPLPRLGRGRLDRPEPARLMAMILGGAVVTLAYLFGLYAAVEAFGGGLPFAVGAVYLAGSAIGHAAPTPGGLGAVEAALIAGLVGRRVGQGRSRCRRCSSSAWRRSGCRSCRAGRVLHLADGVLSTSDVSI